MNSGKCFSLLLIVLSSAACSGIAARGSVGGQTIETRLDSEVARYYLASYLAGERGDAALDERIDHIYRSANGRLPDRRTLKDLSDDFSLDFASLYLADQIARSPVNRRFQDAFERVRDYTRNDFRTGRVSSPPQAADFEVVFVPGYLYKRVRVTGADFAVPRWRCNGPEFSNTSWKPMKTLPSRRMPIWSPRPFEPGCRLAVV